MAIEIPGILAAIFGAQSIDNILTDPIFAGSFLGILPKTQRDDIQKRAYKITKLLDSGKSIVYAAQKDRRQLSKEEKDLLRKTAEEAEKEINGLYDTYENKFTLGGHKSIAKTLEETTNQLKLEVENFKQLAGVVSPAAVKEAEIKGKVLSVHDGDTITIGREIITAPTGTELGPKLTVGVKMEPEVVRLVGIDAPESVTTAGQAATQHLRQLILGKEVTVKSDPAHLRGTYGRRLGVVFLNGVNINLQMLKDGYADYFLPEPNALVYPKLWKAAAKDGGETNINLPLADLKSRRSMMIDRLRAWRNQAKADARAAIYAKIDEYKSDRADKLEEARDWYHEEKDKLKDWYRGEKETVRAAYKAKKITREEKATKYAEIRAKYTLKKAALRNEYREKKRGIRDPYRKQKAALKAQLRTEYRKISKQYWELRRQVYARYAKGREQVKARKKLTYTPEVSIPDYKAPEAKPPSITKPIGTAGMEEYCRKLLAAKPEKKITAPKPPEKTIVQKIAEQLEPEKKKEVEVIKKHIEEVKKTEPLPATSPGGTWWGWLVESGTWKKYKVGPYLDQATASKAIEIIRSSKPKGHFMTAGLSPHEPTGKFTLIGATTAAPVVRAPTPKAQTFTKWVTVGGYPLHVRASPEALGILVGSKTLRPGARFQVKGWVRGQNIGGEDRWWVSMYGHYVWVGGTIEKPS